MQIQFSWFSLGSVACLHVLTGTRRRALTIGHTAPPWDERGFSARLCTQRGSTNPCREEGVLHPATGAVPGLVGPVWRHGGQSSTGARCAGGQAGSHGTGDERVVMASASWQWMAPWRSACCDDDGDCPGAPRWTGPPAQSGFVRAPQGTSLISPGKLVAG